MKERKCGVASSQRLSAEKLQQKSVLSRDSHRYHLLSHWIELAFSLSERSSSENRIFSEDLRLVVGWLSHLVLRLT